MTTKPTSTPKSTENSLNAKDIATIIKVAKSAGITHFRYGTLEFSLKKEENSSKTDGIFSKTNEFSSHFEEKGAGNGDGGIPIKESDEDILNELMISNPLAYEEEISRRLAAAGDENG